MTPMRRRDFVKGIVAAPTAVKAVFGEQVPSSDQSAGQGAAARSAPIQPPPTPANAFRREALGFKAAPIATLVPDAVAATETHFFSDDQLAALRKLCELLMPPLNGYPGATQAGAPEFLDFLIGVSPADRQEMYQSGLDHLNKEAKKQFGTSFAEVNASQADALLRPMLTPWVRDHPPADPLMRFMSLAHEDIRTATMNSQAWSVAATSAGERAPGLGLYWAPIDPDIEKYV